MLAALVSYLDDYQYLPDQFSLAISSLTYLFAITLFIITFTLYCIYRSVLVEV